MKTIKFTKMHGAGNDYVYVNAIDQKIENPSELAIQVSNRNFGIGSDGLVLIHPSEKSDFRMQMFNSDGSEAEMCGNASRCVGKWLYDNKLTTKTTISLETKAGEKYLTLLEGDKRKRLVQVDMGEPILEAVQIPVVASQSPVINLPLDIDGKEWTITAVSMGNPHAVTFLKDIDKLDLIAIGPKFETNKAFPRKTNTEFIEVLDRNHINMRVWERGAGETLACGTGACASVVASVLNGFCDREVSVKLIGGTLQVKWDEASNHVFMTGEAVTVFEGELYL